MNVIRHHLLRQGRTTSLLFQNVQKCKLVTTKRNYSSSPRKIGQPIPETHPHLLKPNECMFFLSFFYLIFCISVAYSFIN